MGRRDVSTRDRDPTGWGRTPPFPLTGGDASEVESRSSDGRRRFRNLLLFAGLDDSPLPSRTFAWALHLARANRTRLTLIDVVREPELLLEVLPPGKLARFRGDRRRSLTRLAALARERGVETETELAVGKPFHEIVGKVQRSGHDLVITDGGRGLGAGVIDSTTRHLLRECPCAIAVVPPNAGKRRDGILAAVDPDAADPKKEALNRRVMEVASSMARLERSVLHVVHVWESPGIAPGSYPEVWKMWKTAARSEIKRRLWEFLAQYDLGPEPRVHLVPGRPAAAIPELVGEEQIDLLVMGTLCRKGVRGFFIGNTAEEVLERVDCSLLTVKPDR